MKTFFGNLIFLNLQPAANRYFSSSRLKANYNARARKTHKLILISGHRGELGLREDERLVLIRLQLFQIGESPVLPDHVDSRLVLVHRIQNHLCIGIKRVVRSLSLNPRNKGIV